LLFFTSANPSLDNGGAYLVSKQKIYKLFKPDLIPNTLLVHDSFDWPKCNLWLANNKISFPVVVKPDFGLRGDGLHVVKNENELEQFFGTINQAYLVQEFVDFEKELGVFVIRGADDQFKITSIVEREFMSVIGDGKSMLEELVLQTPRYAMQYDSIKNRYLKEFDKVIRSNEVFYFERIGNHSKGTKFKNGNYLNTQSMTKVMSETMNPIEGFNYGRLDIKYASLEGLLRGDGFKIIELNGVFSEPAHIYDPDATLLGAWRDLLTHFKALLKVSQASIQNGNQPSSLFDGLKKINRQFKLQRRLHL